MAKTIKRVLLAQVKYASSTLLDALGVSQFKVGDPYSISPTAWDEEAGLTHYGYVLELPKLQDKQNLETAFAAHPDSNHYTLLDWRDNLDDTLASVGLRVNSLA